MRTAGRPLRRWLSAGLALAALLLTTSPAAATGDSLFFLVRHAEKTAESQDPALSEAGKQRALLLAGYLREAGIEWIHSTDYRRTRDTAAPLARLLDRDVELYDPSDLQGFARRLAASPGRHLVVGHSNTTPELVELLGGEPGAPFDEAQEYDRIYILHRDGEGSVTTVVLRFGEPFRPQAGSVR